MENDVYPKVPICIRNYCQVKRGQGMVRRVCEPENRCFRAAPT